MKNVLITGGTGALGKAVISQLMRENKYRITSISRFNTDKNGLQFNICDEQQLSSTISEIKPDLIFHLAASFSTNFDESYAVNVATTRCLLDNIQQSGIKTRLVLIGSAAEYGIVKPEENPIQEGRVLNPVSTYGLTKAWQTQLGMMYANRGVDVVITRIFNLKGFGMSEKLFFGRLEKQVNDVLAGRKSIIELGSLTATRDYISTHQAAEQLITIAEKGESGNIYHIASGIPITIRNLLIEYLTLHNLDISIVRESPELSNHSGYDVPMIYADITKTHQLIKYDRNYVKN